MRALAMFAVAVSLVHMSSATTFIQKTCVDAKCSNCTVQQFPVGTCISRNSHSYIVSCETNGILINEFDNTACSGESRLQSQSAGACDIVFGTFDTQTFIQQYCSSSPPAPPSPPTPVTPAPAVPTPAPPAATFTQETCTDSACSQGCTAHTFDQNTCLQLTGGGTAVAVCTSQALELTIYSSTDCSGAGETTSQPINSCVQDNTGTYLENFCNGTTTTTRSTKPLRLSSKKY